MEKEKDKEKQIALENTIKHLEKDYGKNIVMRLGDKEIEKAECFSSGSLSLDIALGIGGFPVGRIAEIYGPESSGKTTLTLHAIAEAQRKGGTCVFIDAEHALDISYAQKIGVNVNDLYITQPSHGEQALEIADRIINSHSVDLVVVDSVAALVPKSEIEGNMGDAQMAMQARLMSQALRKITASLSLTKTTLIFINQLRMKIGVFFGNPETTTGGNALKFYASMRLDIRKIETLKKGDEMIGSKVRVKVVKNKMAPPFKTAEFEIYYGEGISKFSEILSLAVKHDIVKKSGSWFSYNEQRIGQGQDNVKKYLRENKDIFKEIHKKVKTLLFPEGEQPTKKSQKSQKDSIKATEKSK